MISRPKSVMCHICGREFGTASIGIHIKNCAKLWEEKESKKPKNERRPLPVAPKDLPLGTSFKDLEKRNNMISEAFTNNVMVQCPNCLRTFLEDRIEVHLRSCTSENPHKAVTGASRNPEVRQHQAKPPTEEKKSSKSPQLPNHEANLIRPKTLMCHICGREFGTTSIEIHQKSCAKLWEERESKKPESQRRPVPEAPSSIPTSKTPEALRAHNDLVSTHYNTNTLLPCPNCKRTFNEDSLQVHLRSCKAKSQIKATRKA